MDLTIINSINNNTYANNLHIQNTHPKRILYLLKQIAKLVDKTFTDNEPYIAINNIIIVITIVDSKPLTTSPLLIATGHAANHIAW